MLNKGGRRILITGGSGLIGNALAADFAGNGNEIIILSRHPETLASLPPGVRAEKWDAQTAEGWGQMADGAEAIINLAGESIGSGRWTEQRKRTIVLSRIEAGRAIVQAVEMSAIKPRVVIQSSAVGYYGPSDGNSITEKAPQGHDFLARVALDWEASTKPVEGFGVRRVVIRTGVVLSNKGGALPKMVAPFRFLAGGRLSDGKQWFPWIHIDDEIRAIKVLIENENADGPFNLTAPFPVDNAEFSLVLGQQLKRHSYLAVPGFALRMLFGEMASVLLEGQKAIPERLLQMGFVFRFPEVRQALKDLLS